MYVLYSIFIYFLYITKTKTCSITTYNQTIYALCNGTYTIDSAIEACHLNGYDIAELNLIQNDSLIKNLTVWSR